MPLTEDEKLAEVNVALGRGSVRIGSMPFWRKFMSYVHDKVSLSTANEFNTLTEVTPAATDRIMVEDASDSFNKKFIEVQDLPFATPLGADDNYVTDTEKIAIAALDTMSSQAASAVAITGGTATFDQTGLGISDGGSWKIEIRNVGTHSADNVLTVDMNDGNRSISLSGDLTVGGTASVSGTNTGDQTLNGLLPSQTGNNGKVLQTDGSNTSWQTVAGGSGLTQPQVMARTLGC